MITEKWLSTHKWMLRSSKNGTSYNGFKWKHLGKWTEAPDWNAIPACGNGLHGETSEFHGFGFQYHRLELCEYEGKAVSINGDKVKVKKARIIAIGKDIPEIAFKKCGYKIANDGDVISPQQNEMWIVWSGKVTVSNQSGGYCGFNDNSQGTVSNQSGGDCWFNDNSQGTVSNQSGGNCGFNDNSKNITHKEEAVN